jgi:hypothetical protein
MKKALRAIICALIGHDVGGHYYWDEVHEGWYRDIRYCHRCGRHL